MVQEFLAAHSIDKARSYMIGDRDTDMEFAVNLGIQGLRIRLDGDAHEAWPAIARRIRQRGQRPPGTPAVQGPCPISEPLSCSANCCSGFCSFVAWCTPC